MPCGGSRRYFPAPRNATPEASLSPTLFLAGDDDTAALGRRLAGALRPGDLVLLDGDLGAGKTALARAIIRTLMDDDALDVPSPSFALVQPYERPGLSLLHADLYRLQSAHEVDELGLFDRSETIVLVEWPERVPELAGRADLVVRLTVPRSGSGREVSVGFADEQRQRHWTSSP